MTAQPVEPGPAGHPRKTLAGIRAAIPQDQRSAFERQRDELDLADLAAVAAFRDKWWARAVLAADHELDAESDAALRGELDLIPGWELGVR
ncbi:hypothetical protein [Streptomyces blattellae]|uniref:hypothetical protein n=1 Tax=Streptomyces blattellae TaxID=2569855 RepID=UPI0012B97F28|nr:hypothetical protein [Streptomyces blattellae]